MNIYANAHPSKRSITQLLIAYGNGERSALNQLLPMVYAELHRIAVKKLQHERPDHTLNATALVHEAYLKLMSKNQASWQSRAHFFALSSRVMRRVLISYARKHKAEKRGGGISNASLEGAQIAATERADELLALNEGLNHLSTFDTRLAQVVEHRFFGGLTIEETADMLGVSSMTVKRDWSRAKAWLYRYLRIA